VPSDPRPERRTVDIDALRRFRLEHLDEPCDLCERRTGIHVHHKVFRSQGGADEPGNLLWLCYICHDDIHAGRISRYITG
jgi:5-methylcytosine-specific restriction endonuclease McrA